MPHLDDAQGDLLKTSLPTNPRSYPGLRSSLDEDDTADASSGPLRQRSSSQVFLPSQPSAPLLDWNPGFKPSPSNFKAHRGELANSLTTSAFITYLLAEGVLEQGLGQTIIKNISASALVPLGLYRLFMNVRENNAEFSKFLIENNVYSQEDYNGYNQGVRAKGIMGAQMVQFASVIGLAYGMSAAEDKVLLQLFYPLIFAANQLIFSTAIGYAKEMNQEHFTLTTLSMFDKAGGVEALAAARENLGKWLDTIAEYSIHIAQCSTFSKKAISVFGILSALTTVSAAILWATEGAPDNAVFAFNVAASALAGIAAHYRAIQSAGKESILQEMQISYKPSDTRNGEMDKTPFEKVKGYKVSRFGLFGPCGGRSISNPKVLNTIQNGVAYSTLFAAAAYIFSTDSVTSATNVAVIAGTLLINNGLTAGYNALHKQVLGRYASLQEGTDENLGVKAADRGIFSGISNLVDRITLATSQDASSAPLLRRG